MIVAHIIILSFDVIIVDSISLCSAFVKKYLLDKQAVLLMLLTAGKNLKCKSPRRKNRVFCCGQIRIFFLQKQILSSRNRKWDER
jgi:hypothetical protein